MIKKVSHRCDHMIDHDCDVFIEIYIYKLNILVYYINMIHELIFIGYSNKNIYHKCDSHHDIRA